jgi:hypothetical protein
MLNALPISPKLSPRLRLVQISVTADMIVHFATVTYKKYYSEN